MNTSFVSAEGLRNPLSKTFTNKGGIMMNTSAVAKMLGVSPSTIQRWVKQANLQMERTELGHYQFSEESIEILKNIQEQLNNGVLLQDLKIKGNKPRKAKVTAAPSDLMYEKLMERINNLENKLGGKADDIVSYQILHHRREIEDLQNEVGRLSDIIESLQQAAVQKETVVEKESKMAIIPSTPFRKFKKRNILSSFFGF
jgi:chromosome-anchoring protein RacA